MYTTTPVSVAFLENKRRKQAAEAAATLARNGKVAFGGKRAKQGGYAPSQEQEFYGGYAPSQEQEFYGGNAMREGYDIDRYAGRAVGAAYDQSVQYDDRFGGSAIYDTTNYGGYSDYGGASDYAM